MASDCNNTTDDPEYDWMEVLDNFLGSDEYEHNETPESNDAGHQLHVQQQRRNSSETTTTMAPSSHHHHQSQEENVPPSNSVSQDGGSSGYNVGYTGGAQTDARNTSVHTDHRDGTSIHTLATNQVVVTQGNVSSTDFHAAPSTSSSHGITNSSSTEIINCHTAGVHVETSTQQTTENVGIQPSNLSNTVNQNSVQISTTDCSGIRLNSDSVSVSNIGTSSAFTPVVPTGFTPIDVTKTTVSENTTLKIENTNISDSQVVPGTNGTDSSGLVVPSTESQIPSVEKPIIVKTLDDSSTFKVDSCGADNNNTSDDNKGQNGWVQSPMFYQPIYFAPYPFYGYWGGNQETGGEGTDASNTVSDVNVNCDKKVEEGVKDTDTKQTIGTTGSITCTNDNQETSNIDKNTNFTGIHLDSNYQSTTNKNGVSSTPIDTSNQSPDGNLSLTNGSNSCLQVSSTYPEKTVENSSLNLHTDFNSTVVKPQDSTGTVSTRTSDDFSNNLLPSTNVSTSTGGKDLCANNSQTKSLEDVTSPVLLVPKLSSTNSTGDVAPDLTKPFTCLSNTSVPCPIFIGSSDVQETEKSTLEANPTRADPTQDKHIISKDRDTRCSTDTSTMTSRDNDLHSTGLSFPDDSGLDGLDQEGKQEARSERKRNREKQRRTDVNAQFAALTSLLRRVEAEDLESDAETEDDDDDSADPGHKTKKRKKCSLSVLGALGQGSPSNRVDLIARTITVMDRLHELSAKRRNEVRKLKKQIKTSKSPEDGPEKCSTIPMHVPSAPNSQMMPMNQPSMMMSQGGKDGQQPFMMMVPMMMGPDGQPQQGMPNCSMPQMQFMGQGCYPMPGGGQPGQPVKMNPQGMSMMPPHMYPGQPPPNQRNSPMPQMMPMYPGMNPQRMAPGGGANSRGSHMNNNSQQPGPQQQVQQQHSPQQQATPSNSRQPQQQQKKNSNGGNLAHCA